MKKLDYNIIDWNEYVYYDETSPTFLRWRVDRRSGRGGKIVKRAAGDVAGCSNAHNYFQTGLFRKYYLNHRIIWVLFNGHIDTELQIDHIDGDKGNNKIENLRLVTKTINQRNCVVQCNSSTGVTGVSIKSSNEGRYYYYIAHWNNIKGKQKLKRFSILKLGEAEAFRRACEYRQKMIEELNSQGAGYTERHGT